jgi:hypothetical protein
LLRSSAIPGRRKGVAYIAGMENKRLLQSIPDDELLGRLAALVGKSRRVEVDIVAHLAEVDERRLHAREAFPSLFVYCTGREALARHRNSRTEAARAPAPATNPSRL